ARRDARFEPRATNDAGLHATGSAGFADLLGDVCDVRARRRGRTDGDRAAGPDSDRFPDRQSPGEHPRADLASADFCTFDRPRAERADAAVFRLGVGPYRPREYDVSRLWS